MEIPGRREIETKFAKRMGTMTERHRKRLVKLMGSPPDPTKVPDEFWTEIERETQQETLALLLVLFMASANFHASGHASGKGMDPVTAIRLMGEGERWSATRSDELGRGYSATAKKRVDTFIDKRTEIIDRAAAKNEVAPMITPEEVQEVSQKSLGPSKAENVAVTETTAAQSAGGDAGIQATTGLSQKDKWHTMTDGKVCPECSPLNGTPRSFWGLKYVDGPPIHGHCRCWIVYENSGGT